jgi:hypothetical protein
MKSKQDIDMYVESANTAFNILGGSVIFFAGAVTLLSGEIQTAVHTSFFSDPYVWYMRVVGFVFMYFAALIMKPQFISLFRKVPGLSTFAKERSTRTVPMMGAMLTAIMIVMGWILAYTPYIGYLFTALFAFGYFTLAKKLSKSKSGVAKVFFILMMLVIFLALLSVVAFIYLTREG